MIAKDRSPYEDLSGKSLCVVACVASVSSQGSSRKLGQEQKLTCNFRPITRLETLATQAMCVVDGLSLIDLD